MEENLASYAKNIQTSVTDEHFHLSLNPTAMNTSGNVQQTNKL